MQAVDCPGVVLEVDKRRSEERLNKSDGGVGRLILVWLSIQRDGCSVTLVQKPQNEINAKLPDDLEALLALSQPM